MDKLIQLIFCHLVGDFPLQSSFIASTKGENWYHLVVHCLLYGLPFYICFGLCWQFYAIIVLHFVVDAAKARYKLFSNTIDQILHYASCLIYFI